MCRKHTQRSGQHTLTPSPFILFHPTLILTEVSQSAVCRPQRYSALFALRNKGGKEAVAILGEVFGARSALLKHETAYVLGQMQDAEAVAVLMRVLKVCVCSDSERQIGRSLDVHRSTQ